MKTDATADGLQKFVEFFENLEQNRLSRLEIVYSQNARFSDPFNDVRGIDEIRSIFEDMYERCASVKFIVYETSLQRNVAYIQWCFEYTALNQSSSVKRIEGVSRIVLDGQGLVVEHRDYWDAARQVYEYFPVVGAVLRFIRRRVSVVGTN